MSGSRINPTKKRGRPPVDSEQVNVRLTRDIIDAVDKFVDGVSIKTRPEAVRYLLRDHLTGLGYIELPPEREDAN